MQGCLFRPLRFDETAGSTELATEVWKATWPPVTAAQAASANGEVKHGGVAYQNFGSAQAFHCLDGVVYHVVVMCRRQI